MPALPHTYYTHLFSYFNRNHCSPNNKRRLRDLNCNYANFRGTLTTRIEYHRLTDIKTKTRRTFCCVIVRHCRGTTSNGPTYIHIYVLYLHARTTDAHRETYTGTCLRVTWRLTSRRCSISFTTIDFISETSTFRLGETFESTDHVRVSRNNFPPTY